MHQPKLRVAALAAAFGLLAGCATTTTTSPTGRQQVVGGVSQPELDQMGAQEFAKLKAQKPQTQNPRERAYVNCVVSDLVQQLPPQWQHYQWETVVFVDSEPNAFALPGAKVGVNTGIFKVARDQDELATVIAHEIGHVISNHHNERITRAQNAQGGLMLAQVLAAMAGVDPNAVGQVGGTIAQTAFLLPNSRAQESEADIVGQQLMARAGFDPRKAVNLWQNMIAEGSARPPQWLSTHPDPQARLGELSRRAAGLMPVYEQARAAGRRPKCG
ncbi:M48 family metallopeptidase [Solilutibacter silvestris]|uniref:Peptidase family M48 n=1 Tax=Solilutibacter silvestris TaxID=1645665 RepID=A0A2K1Q143_9GAMM|nr:M48 family metallopeptidase [Lysobacter silvestris]PNS08762.1 Peptidase family M48 [Lysobacter silvestris]